MDAGEKQVAILLTVITAVVIAAAIVQLTIRVALALITTEQDAYWRDGLIRILGDLLTVLIAWKFCRTSPAIYDVMSCRSSWCW